MNVPFIRNNECDSHKKMVPAYYILHQLWKHAQCLEITEISVRVHSVFCV